jgi:hypothetical protein
LANRAVWWRFGRGAAPLVPVAWGQMMAAGVLALIPACIFFAFIQRDLVQGLPAGALKAKRARERLVKPCTTRLF